MGTPQPKYPLDAHCSVVHNNTLYVYSPAGFQSLKLEHGAQWEVLPMDVSLTGARCVRAAPQGDHDATAKLYLVGGSVNATAASWDYPGLMAYSFSNRRWDWIRPKSWVTQNRQNHAAVYLADSQKILVYAGSQTPDDLTSSTQTFLFSTLPPYAVQSLQSAGAPPLVQPMLLPTDTKSALLVGGSPTNTAVWRFSEAEGWRNLGVTLAQPVADMKTVQYTAVVGSDGRVVLDRFDMGATPNTAQRIQLTNANGSPAAPGSSVMFKAKRATVSQWPPYNATYAPTISRSGFSLAQADDGTTVVSGGSSTDPLVLFDAQSNSWLNATQVLGEQSVMAASISASGYPTSTASVLAPGATGDAIAPPAGASNGKAKMLTVLGATLGAVFGMALFLILILICLRHKKKRRQSPSHYVEKEDRMSFADRGAEFMKEAGGAVVAYHQPSFGNESATSLAIIQGRGGSGHKRNMASDASTAGLVKKSSPLGYSEPVELSKFDMKPEQASEKIVRQNSGRKLPVKTTLGARSSGWSRYFANNEATNLASVQADRSTYASDRTSGLSRHRISSTYGPPQLAPLDIPTFDGQRLSRVASGSPTLGTPSGLLPHQVQPMQAELGRANSSSMRSDISDEDDYFHRPVESWTPVGDNHRTSSNYTGSVILEISPKYDLAGSYHPDGTDSRYANRESISVSPTTPHSTVTTFPSRHAPTARAANAPSIVSDTLFPQPPRLGAPQDRESTVTLFPDGLGAQSKAVPSPTLGSFYTPSRPEHASTVTMFPGRASVQKGPHKGQPDMSWLNLGTSR